MTINYVPTTTVILDRVRYFSRQLITADDMRAEQDYFRQKLRQHNRYLHGWGVVCGCEVTPQTTEHPWQVRVSPGYLVTPRGDEVLISDPTDFDLAGDWRQASDPCAHAAPCPPISGMSSAAVAQTFYLAACYVECNTRPVRMQAAGCGCDDTACEYSRIRESFMLVRLAESELPQSHTVTKKADEDWRNAIAAWVANGSDGPKPMPSCPTWPQDDCVVLARIQLPSSRNAEIVAGNIFNEERHVLYSLSALDARVLPH